MAGKAVEVRDCLLTSGGHSFGAGWSGLVADMLLEILNRLEAEGVNLESLTRRDFEVKEKRGRLVCQSSRFDGFDDIAERYEMRSMCVCEVCGAVGRLSGEGTWWLSTRCSNHRIY